MPACEIERQVGGTHANLCIPASVLSSRVCSFAILQRHTFMPSEKAYLSWSVYNRDLRLVLTKVP